MIFTKDIIGQKEKQTGELNKYTHVYDELTIQLGMTKGVFLSYLINKEPLLKRTEDGYFRISNSFIQEVFSDASPKLIREWFKGLEEAGVLSCRVLSKGGSFGKERFIKLIPEKILELLDPTVSDQKELANNMVSNQKSLATACDPVSDLVSDLVSDQKSHKDMFLVAIGSL